MNEHEIEAGDIDSLEAIFEDVATNGSVWAITREGKPVACVVSEEDYKLLTDAAFWRESYERVQAQNHRRSQALTHYENTARKACIDKADEVLDAIPEDT